MKVALIGVDCAAQANKTGLALAEPGGDRIAVLDAKLGSKRALPAGIITDWVHSYDRVLIALDAPLGWPALLSTALVAHQAGGALAEKPNALFRRLTDDRIFDRLKKRSFDVGADRIARASHSALTLLEDLRESL